MTYERRASPLHAARAGAGGGYCLALAIAALVLQHPLALAAVLAAVAGAGALAASGRAMARAARMGAVLALLVALINPLVVSDGLTVLVRLGDVPPFGQRDLTLEALVYGAMLGLRALTVILCFALATAAVDPDEVLRLFRRLSLRSALSAALATRLVPVLQRDAQRLADAQRCRPSGGAGRVAVVRAVAATALDRAVDVAATLEVRGYGASRRQPRGGVRPWSRHDVAFLAAAVGLVMLALGARLLDVASFSAYPLLHVPTGAAEAILAVAVVAVALAPFADRRGIEP
jgi:energy-coupling factor transport system permease protein